MTTRGHSPGKNRPSVLVNWTFLGLFIIFFGILLVQTTPNRELNTLKMPKMTLDEYFDTKIESTFRVKKIFLVKNVDEIFTSKYLSWVFFDILSVFSSRFGVVCTNNMPKKMKNRPRKVQFTKTEGRFFPRDCPRALTSYPYGSGDPEGTWGQNFLKSPP